MRQTSRDKIDHLRRATAGSTTSALDGYGLRCHWPARPAPYALYPVLVHRLASLLHASFRPRLATTPLRFAITSPPSGCEEDLHLQAVNHARRTKEKPRIAAGLEKQVLRSRYALAQNDSLDYSEAAISSASPSWRMSSSSRSASSYAVWTSCWTRWAASSSSGESWMLR